MKLHVVSLPHTQTTKAYSTCAYTQKVRKFCDMMSDLGYEVVLYASEDNEAEVSELVTCITKGEQELLGFYGPEDYIKIDFNPSGEIWGHFNKNVINAMEKRIGAKDLICIITSSPAEAIVDAFPSNISIEFGIGYSHTLKGKAHRVFESYAWMHYVYGAEGADGNDFDAVIPNYFEPEEFPLGNQDGGYYLFIGRITEKKGYRVAIEVCEKLNKKLVIAGPNTDGTTFPDHVEYVGVVGPKERAKLMGGAKAVFVPTRYIGPFEGVAVEALMCGTPVITTDFGAFTEYVNDGVNGFRCRSFQDYIDAVETIERNKHILNNWIVRRAAINQFSVDIVSKQYDRYFKKLQTLHKDGWYTT